MDMVNKIVRSSWLDHALHKSHGENQFHNRDIISSEVNCEAMWPYPTDSGCRGVE